MKRYIVFFALLFTSIISYSQKTFIEDYDLCAEEISEDSKKQFKKAYSFYKEGKYEKSFPLLKTLTEEEPEFASPYFLLGLIGVAKENSKMIEKYFPLVIEICPQYSHPLLYYHLGVIDYTYARYTQAINHFEQFLNFTLHNNKYSKMQHTAINYIQWSEFLDKGEKDRYPFIPQKIDNLNTKEDESKAFITLDEEQAFFIRKIKQRSKNEESFYQQTTFQTKEVLCQSYRTFNEETEQLEYEEGFPISELENQLHKPTKPSLTADNKQMYISILDKTSGKYQIYTSQNISGVWSEPQPIDIIVNQNTSNQIEPFITADGNTLYFSSDRVGGQGGYDIWVTNKSKNGSWLKPTNLGKRINTPLNEYSPYLHPDNNNFYFSSNGWKGYGELDLFYINLKDIKMKEPINIGQDINSEYSENEITLKKDGKTAYRTQWDSINKNYNIVTYQLPEKCRASEIHLLHLQITDKQIPAYNCKIDLYNLTENTNISYFTSNDSEQTTLALKPNDKYLIKIEKPQYAFSCTAIDKPHTLDSLSIEIKMIQFGETYPLQNNKLFLDEFVQYLKDNPRTRIQLLGKTEEAKEVQEYLLKNGLREDRVRLCTKQTSPTLSYIIE